MENFFLTLMVVTILGAATYIKQDPFNENRFTIYNEKWERTGYIIQDKLCPDKFNVYDQDWNRKGYLKKRSFDRWDLDEID